MIRLPLFRADVPPPPAASAPLGQGRVWLQEVWTEPFAAAVELASPDLAAQARRLLAQPAQLGAVEAKVTGAVARYARRAAGRSTPFGLFAGVAPVEFAEVSSVAFGSGHAVVPRVDGVWLTDVVARLEQEPVLLRRLPVRANELAVVRDGRLVLAHQPTSPGGGGLQEISVALTGPVVIAMRTAREPVRFDQVAALLGQDFPDTPAGVVEAMLGGLVRQGFWTTSLRPDPSSTEPLADLLGALAAARACEVPSVARLVGLLESIAAMARPATIDDYPAGRWREIASRQREITPAARPIGAGTRADMHVILPEHVVDQAEQAAGLLTRLTAFPAGQPAWVDYHGRFLERYGPGAVVPVFDLLAETGLGWPAGFIGTRITMPPAAPLKRERALLRLAQHAALSRTHEVVLDEQLVSELTVGEPSVIQPHTEVRFELHAPDRAALDHGDYQLQVIGASRAAGTTTGRFWHLLDRPSQDRIRAAMRDLPTLSARALRAQVAVGPLNLRTLNITASPQMFDHAIGPDRPATDTAAEQIRVEDLAVTVDVDGMGLVSLRHDGAPVEAVAFTAIELTRAAHPLARFLCEITTARAAPCDLLDWGAAAGLPFLPQVRAGAVVLNQARWQLRAADLPAELGTDWRQELTRWRDRYMVPGAVLLSQDDRRLPLDLEVAADQDLLHAHLVRHGTARLVEAPGPDAFGWLDGRPHEIVVPLASQQPTPTPPSPPRFRVEERLSSGTAHLPGHGRWLSASLYAHSDRLDGILIDHLPGLLAHLPAGAEWWFLPYRDPAPHLRLRIRIGSDMSHGAGMEQLGAWTASLRDRRLASHVGVDTYRPETGRYGHGELLEAAHGFFAADSASARLQRAATRRTPAARDALTAAAVTRIVAAMTGGPPTGARWLLDHAPRTSNSPLDRQVRADAIKLADPDDGLAFSSLPGASGLAAAWYRRDVAARTYRAALTRHGADPAAWIPDLLHLHAVRMHGPRPDDEARVVHLARAAALAQTARARSHA